MTELIPNTALAYRVLDKARANNDHFDMGVWGFSASGAPVSLDDLTASACGTTACLAGWTVAMAGYRVDQSATVFDLDGKEVGDAVLMASEMLGITEEQAIELFYAGHGGLDVTVAEIFGPRPHDVGAVDDCRRCQDGGLAAELSWRECGHRADFASPAEHERECPAHGVDREHAGLGLACAICDGPCRIDDDVPPNAGSAS